MSASDEKPRFLDPLTEIERHANRLPHWQQDHATFFVTFRLADSIPQTKLAPWRAAREAWVQLHPRPWTPEQDTEYHERFSRKIEEWLDTGEGECLLRAPPVARIVGAALNHFEGRRSRQHAWVVMPNHVHTLFSLLATEKLEALLHSWKSFTAHAINAELARIGSVWEEDYFDRMIRNEKHFGSCVRYIRNNASKARVTAGCHPLFERDDITARNPLGAGASRPRITQAGGGTPPLPAMARCLAGLLGLAVVASAQTNGAGTLVTVHADRVLFRLAPTTIGANMEDLHYQMVGGFDSQMLHGESFFEHSPTELAPLKGQLDGFANVNGQWTATNGEVAVVIRHGAGTPWLEGGLAGGRPPVLQTNALAKDAGARLTSLALAPADTIETRAAFRFSTHDDRVASLIAHVHPNQADSGWNWYAGYTVELDPRSNTVRLLAAQRASRHGELAKCALDMPRGTWFSVALRVTNALLVVRVAGRDVLTHAPARLLPPGHFGIVARGGVGVRELALVSASGSTTVVPLRPNPLLAEPGDALSFRWARVQRGSAEGAFAFDPNGWHAGLRSQQIIFKRGDGEFGCDNAGLARSGLALQAGKPYEGFLRVKTRAPQEVVVSLRADDGQTILAEAALPTKAGETFQRLSFALTPASSASKGRFAITLRKPGEATVGYAFLQPGEWGRFKGLPVRKDLAEALLAQGIGVLRFNGGMIEVPGYRWKNLRGPRDERPPYDGFYDRYCSSGFGPAEAVAFGKAAGLPVAPGLNLDETPADVADFVAACRPPFYQHANESGFNRKYVDTFKRVAEAVWKVAPEITLITTRTGVSLQANDSVATARKKLALHLELAEFARAHGKPIMFDCHSFNGAAAVQGIAAFARWLERLAPDPKLVSVGILEFNAGAFDFQRGLNHALELNAAHRAGDVIRAVGTPNVSQPWGVYQSDWKAVLWTQGNIYYTGDRVWFQAAYYVDQMLAKAWAPDAVAVESAAGAEALDIFAAKSADSTKLVLRVVNPTGAAQPARFDLRGATAARSPARVTTLAHNDPADFNTLAEPERIKPVTTEWRQAGHSTARDFPPYSFTVIELSLDPQTP